MTTVLLWGFNFVAIKLLFLQLSPSAAALSRFIIMYICLVVLCKARGLSLRYPRKDTPKILFQGFLAMGLYMVLFLGGMGGSTAAEGAIILGTGPIFTLLFAVAVGQERFQVPAIIGSIIAFGGVALVVLSASPAHAAASSQPMTGLTPRLVGNLMVFCSAAIWAWGTVLGRSLVTRYDPLQLLTLSMPGALAALIPYGFFPMMHTDWAHLSVRTWAMLFYVSILAGAVGFALFYGGVKAIGASNTMVYQYFVAPLAAIFAWLTLGSALGPWQLVGLGIVLCGVAICNRTRTKTAAPQPEIPPE